MRRYIAHAKYTIQHKIFVFKACMMLGVPLMSAILHDWDKFIPWKFHAYAMQFFEKDGSRKKDFVPREDFREAVEHHHKINRHHWQHWAKYKPGKIMPPDDLKEMVADWIGAGLAKEQPMVLEWFESQIESGEMIMPEFTKKICRFWLKQAKMKGMIPG